MGGADYPDIGLSVYGCSVVEQFWSLPMQEQRRAIFGIHAGGEYLIDKISTTFHEKPAWGYHINWMGGCSSCGPFWSKEEALVAAKKALKEKTK
jgi:hypothetical protein